MIKLLTTYKRSLNFSLCSKYRTAWIGFLIAMVASFIMATTTGAQQTDQEAAKKHDVTFPISELGGCGSISECRSFCEDPVNKSSCVSFAKQKGFYKEQGSDRQKEMLEKASSDLGCSSPDACREFCHQEANFDKCSSFAKKHNFQGGQADDPERAEVLQKARQTLGCDSPDACRAFCHEEGNREKCSQFAKDSGLRGGEKRVGPGGCSSEETCKSFCSDPSNFSACSSFGQGEPGGPSGPGGRGQFRGPGGCTSEESCRSHCEQNPQACKIIPTRFDGAGPIDNPQQAQEQFKKFCEGNPDKCQGGGNFSPFSKEGRGKFEEFCKDNPEKCRGEGDSFKGEMRGNPEQFCIENPEKCKEGAREGFGGNPEEFCKNNPDKCKGPQGQQFPGGQDQFCKDNPEKCRPGGQMGGPKDGSFDPAKMPEGFKRPPEGFKPGEGQRPPEGFRPQEGSNRPPDGQRPSEGFQSGPDGGGHPPGGDQGSSGPSNGEQSR